jgi:predicted DNA-binding transcriptional regulator YafY
MRRADRLFRIVQLLRAGRLQTARSLAQKLQVSGRTIYRDVQDLQLSGVPILGEAGVGYTLRRDFDLPPLMFDRREITALVLGSRMVAAWGDTELASAANDALRKIEAVLTPALRDKIDAVPLYVPANRGSVQETTRATLEQLRSAIEGVRKIVVSYCDEKSQTTERTLRPMALLFWGNVWTLVAWCELRVDFRSFRVDRFAGIQILEETFVQDRGQRYEDFLRKVRSRLSREYAPASPHAPSSSNS